VEGLSTILEKRAKVALVGGVSAKISPFSLERARLAKILSSSRHSREMGCRPFSRLRTGTVLGEGCGVLVLESRSTAIARSAHFVARISGYGLGCDKTLGCSASTERAITCAAGEAIARADLSPQDIDLVIAHGDGTWEGDKNEIRAIEALFSGRPRRVKVFSSKGSLGNCLAGSMALDLVLGECILEHQACPATLNCDPLDDGLEFDVIRSQPQRAHPRRILINARSPEGQCASLVVEACT
jgi:3-oxoacyl-[acyl-carrier-protein] synthase II